MEFLDEKIQQYAEQFSTPASDFLNALEQETWQKILMPRMVSGHIQGRILSLLSCLVKPKTILEIGTYTGYSAICLAEGLAEGGKLITIDINEEIAWLPKKYFELTQNTQKIDYKIGNALDIIPNLNTSFDLVFIDADKINYANYFDLIIDKMNPNGLIIADNVLWSGKVLDNSIKDEDTLALKAFNQKVHQDTRVENLLLPVRDGLMLLRKL